MGAACKPCQKLSDGSDEAGDVLATLVFEADEDSALVKHLPSPCQAEEASSAHTAKQEGVEAPEQDTIVAEADTGTEPSEEVAVAAPHTEVEPTKIVEEERGKDEDFSELGKEEPEVELAGERDAAGVQVVEAEAVEEADVSAEDEKPPEALEADAIAEGAEPCSPTTASQSSESKKGQDEAAKKKKEDAATDRKRHKSVRAPKPNVKSKKELDEADPTSRDADQAKMVEDTQVEVAEKRRPSLSASSASASASASASPRSEEDGRDAWGPTGTQAQDILLFEAETLAQRYFDAVKLIETGKPKKGSPGSAEKLVLLGLTKQVNDGDVNTPKPGVIGGLQNRARWNAWNALKGMDKKDAMEEYVKQVGIQAAKYQFEARGHATFGVSK